jgi:transcriptional regulator with XRE-family HTH domain
MAPDETPELPPAKQVEVQAAVNAWTQSVAQQMESLAVEGLTNSPGSTERGLRFGQLIKDARIKAKMSQDDLATASGVSRSTIIRWESGKAERPDPAQVRAACEVLRVDPREAAVALGFLTREEAYSEARPLSPLIEAVIEALEDPAVNEAEKATWLQYLMFIRIRAISSQFEAILDKLPPSESIGFRKLKVWKEGQAIADSEPPPND